MSEVEIVHSSTKRVWLRTTCSCMSDNHPLTVEIECDKENNDLTLYFKCLASEYSAPREHMDKDDYSTLREMYVDFYNLCHRMWWRVKSAIYVLINGYIEVEEAFIFRSKDHVDGFINAIIQGRDNLESSVTENERLKAIIKDLKDKINNN